MSYASKRHYRVAQRDKELMGESNRCPNENIQKITIFAIIVYLFTSMISFVLGYVIGKNE